MQSLSWYYHRLSVMSSLEISHRLYWSCRALIGLFHHWPKADDLSINQVWEGPCTAQYFRSRSNLFFCDVEQLDPNDFPEKFRREAIEEAEQLLSHKFSFFSFRKEDFGEHIDWNYDYLTGISVPVSYSPYLDYRDSSVVGNEKSVRELNRHQHLVRLAQAYFLTRSPRFAHEIIDQVTSWIDQCPYMQGMNWTSPIESGLRLISWMWAFELIRCSGIITDEFAALFIRSIYQHLRYIHNNYSLHSSANNHLVAEASGAYIASTYWYELKHSNQWRRRAYDILCHECHNQNWEDGVNKEQSLGYQCFVIDLLLLPALLGTLNNEPFPPSYWNTLEKMVEFVAWVSDCNCNTPSIGDEDGGFAIQLAARNANCTESLLNTAAIIFNRSDLKTWARGRVDEKTLWIFGSSGLKRYNKLGSSYLHDFPRSNRCFNRGGYYIFRSGTDTQDEALLIFDCGPLGWPSAAGHGHADALSITLNIGGKKAIIDPGTYTYEGGYWRKYFKATPQHNTLAFGDESQAQYWDRFIWGKRFQSKLMAFQKNKDNVYIRGRVDWCNGNWHERELFWYPQKNCFKIRDQWKGLPLPVIRFCMSPAWKSKQVGHSSVFTHSNARLEVESSNGPTVIEKAYVSHQFLYKSTTCCVCIKLGSRTGETTTRVSWEIGKRKGVSSVRN